MRKTSIIGREKGDIPISKIKGLSLGDFEHLPQSNFSESGPQNTSIHPTLKILEIPRFATTSPFVPFATNLRNPELPISKSQQSPYATLKHEWTEDPLLAPLGKQ